MGTFVKEIGTLEQTISGRDSVAIVKHIGGLAGGVTLDTTGFTDKNILSGHVVIRETATGNYKPMPVTGGNAYAALPADHTYAGIVHASVATEKPFIGLMDNGIANEVVCSSPYPLAPIKAAFQAAVPFIQWTADNK